jgi:nucleoside-diphosphate-sugar epimerase
LQQGARVVTFDLGDRGHRLDLLLSPDEQAGITFVKGDLRDFDHLAGVFQEHGITHVIHLAALQVPFCRADPVLGSQVNVTGTVNVFESARRAGLKHVAYASSIAVYGPPDRYLDGPLEAWARMEPHTLYGVYKQANEGIARVYWLDHGISSTTLRPFTVYGVGRDQGLTSDPTKAMLAAAAGADTYQIQFGGETQLQLASDVALQFIDAARTPVPGAYGYNLGGETLTIGDLARRIEAARPGITVTHTATILPFPSSFDDTLLQNEAHTVYETPLQEGIEQTIRHFERCLKAGRLSYQP